LLRANPAQPPKPKSQTGGGGRPQSHGSGHGGPGGSHSGPSSQQASTVQSVSTPQSSHARTEPPAAHVPTTAPVAVAERPRRAKRTGGPRRENDGPQSAFAEELARAL
jgi:hypothetical protein